MTDTSYIIIFKEEPSDGENDDIIEEIPAEFIIDESSNNAAQPLDIQEEIKVEVDAINDETSKNAADPLHIQPQPEIKVEVDASEENINDKASNNLAEPLPLDAQWDLKFEVDDDDDSAKLINNEASNKVAAPLPPVIQPEKKLEVFHKAAERPCASCHVGVAGNQHGVQIKQTKKWSEANQMILLDLWGKNIEGLKGPGKNTPIYNKIAEQLSGSGVLVIGRDVKNKLDNLTRKYRHEKQKIADSGGIPSYWEHYTSVHTILSGYEPFNNSETVEDIIDFSPLSSENSVDDDETFNSFNSPVESRVESPIEPPSKKRKNMQTDERDFRRRMLELAEERNDAMLKIVGATIRMEENMIRFLSRRPGDNNNAQ